MNPAVQAVGGLTGEQMAHVLAATEAAPTFRGSRPWHLHCTATTAELRVNRSSGTGDEKENAADSGELLLACGAALFMRGPRSVGSRSTPPFNSSRTNGNPTSWPCCDP